MDTIEKFYVKVEMLVFSNSEEVRMYTIREVEWTDEDDWIEIDTAKEGTYYKGKEYDYNSLIDLFEEEFDEEHTDSYEEDGFMFDNLEEANKKFNELLESEKSSDSNE